MRRGFTVIEVLIVVAIIAILSAIVLSSFVLFRNSQALDRDTETVVEVLRQARTLTLASQNASSYGMHFATTSVTLFAGTSYNASDPNNQQYKLTGSDTVVSVTLTGGGSNIIFNRLTGETAQNGTITLTSTGSNRSRTIVVYKTGIIEFQ